MVQLIKKKCTCRFGLDKYFYGKEIDVAYNAGYPKHHFVAEFV